MSKRTLILTAQSETILNGDNIKEYMDYSKSHDLYIYGEIHYPPIMLFLNPEEMVNMIMDENPEAIIVNDIDFVIADIYHDGQLLKMFEDRGVYVYNTEYDHSLADFNQLLDKDVKEMVKAAVHNYIEETLNESERHVAVMTIDSSRDELVSFVEEVSDKECTNVCVFDVREFDSKISKKMDRCIHDLGINKIIIYDNELLTSTLKQYLHNLQEEDIDIVLKEDYDMNIDRYQEMTIN